jgi:excisionase family DNA binding protein
MDRAHHHRAVTADPLGKQLYKVAEAMTVLSVSRSVIYEEIRSGRLRSVKRGRSRLISALAIAEYVALLEHETKAA